MTDKDQAVRPITNIAAELKNALSPPSTKPATFAAPIYSPKIKVEPKRSVVILVGLVAGGFLGFIFLVADRVKNNIRKQLKTA
jgi:LPS O-antigen subunit length determinant protein (WzzB/FepE family)